MGILHLPLIFQFENRTSGVTKDAKIVNGYVEGEAKDKYRVYKRPGIGTGTLYEAAAAQGTVNYLGVARVVVANKFYKTSATSVAVDTGGAVVDFA